MIRYMKTLEFEPFGAKLSWDVIRLVRRAEVTATTLATVRSLDMVAKQRLLRLGFRWLTGPEFGAFAKHIEGIQGLNTRPITLKAPGVEIKSIKKETLAHMKDAS